MRFEMRSLRKVAHVKTNWAKTLPFLADSKYSHEDGKVELNDMTMLNQKRLTANWVFPRPLHAKWTAPIAVPTQFNAMQMQRPMHDATLAKSQVQTSKQGSRVYMALFFATEFFILAS